MNTSGSSNWKRELRETSAGVYRITLRDAAGRVRYSATGDDEKTLIREAENWLANLDMPPQSRRP